MTAEIVVPLVGVAILCLMVLAAIALRIPAWNPTYLYAFGLGGQIVAGMILAEQINYSCDPWFWACLVFTDCLCVAILLLLSMRYLPAVQSKRTLEDVFLRIRLTEDRRFVLIAALAGMAALHLAITGYLTLKWKAPPVIAMRQHGDAIAQEVNRDEIVAISTYEPFTVPFVGIFADSTVSAAVAIYFVLLFDAWNRGRRTPLIPSLSLVAIGLCAVLHVQRNSLVGGLLAGLYLWYLTGMAKVRHLALGGLFALAYIAVISEFRHGTEDSTGVEMPALSWLSVVGKLVETPLVYLGTGPLNFDAFWSYSDVRGNGNLLVVNSLPGKLEPILGLERYDVVGYFLREDLFVIHGQTLRTGWFDFYFDFDVAGLFVAAIVLPLMVFYLYYRTLATSGRSPSMLFFVLVRPICFFPFINWFLSMTAWSAIFAGLFLDWVLRDTLMQEPPEAQLARVDDVSSLS